MIGIKKSDHANDGPGIKISRGVISYKRSLVLTRCLRLNNKTTREERRRVDKLAAIRTLRGACVHNSKTCFKLSKYTTIDEMLLLLRSRWS